MLSKYLGDCHTSAAALVRNDKKGYAALLALRADCGGCALYTPAGVVVRNYMVRRSRLAFPSREGGTREACDG